MKTSEIRSRLKHCAGLLYGLSIDLNNDGEELARLRAENRRLKAECDALLGKKPKRKKSGRVWTEQDRIRQSEEIKEYHARKKALKESGDADDKPGVS